ncbi:MAG: PhzF family phenazine biosynthesis protein [Candidatus Krumholzibacteriota bacterium]|nr:PhzF family phenazine biosynthesis protein [Candidatus Krumholzibacteriota bacterium]
MDNIKIKRIDVFTTSPFGGNPAGVIIDMEKSVMGGLQDIAAEMRMNLIELAYICRSDSPKTDFRIRFYTPDKELEFSGHVAIGACYALIEEGMIELADGLTTVLFETRIGNVPIDIYFNSDGGDSFDGKEGIRIKKGVNSKGILWKMMMQQPLYHFREASVDAGEIASVLGIDRSDITSTGLPVVTASNEIDWLIIPVKSKETLLSMHPDLIKLGIMNRKYGVWSNHIFTLDTFDPGCVTYSRNFSPLMGLWEDPASANGSAGLGAYLRHFGITASDSIVMQQGNEIDSLARMQVEFTMDGSSIGVVRVGGLAVNSIERSLDASAADRVV